MAISVKIPEKITEYIKKPEAIVLIKKMNSQDFRIHPDILQRAIISLKD